MSERDPHFYRERRPIPALADLLSAAWVQGVASDAPAYVSRTVPNGSIEISAEVGSAPVVTGPQHGPLARTLEPGTNVVGVRFRSGAAGPVLGVPAPDLVDRRVELDELWGRQARRLQERLAEAESLERASSILEAEVLARSSDVADPDPLVAEVVRRLTPRAARGVAGLPGELWISERQLRRRVLAGLGLGPKVLHRLLRFQRFLALANTGRGRGTDLAALAIDAGFADQAHLTRESVRLSDLTPRALLESITEGCGPTHDHTPSYLPLLEPAA